MYRKIIFDTFCGTNISSTKITVYIKPIHRYELVISCPLISVSISVYRDNGTAKVPISATIGVRVQGLTSKIWNESYNIYDVLFNF